MNRVIRFFVIFNNTTGYGLPDVDSTGDANPQRRCWWDAPDSEDRKSSWKNQPRRNAAENDSRLPCCLGILTRLPGCLFVGPPKSHGRHGFVDGFWSANPLNIMTNASFYKVFQILRRSRRFLDNPRISPPQTPDSHSTTFFKRIDWGSHSL